MTNKILMPALSPTMTEGSLTKWLVKVGDHVKAGDILAEIETDKATMEIEAVDEGKVTKLIVSEGASSVLVNSAIAILDGPDEEYENNENNKYEKEIEFQNSNDSIDSNDIELSNKLLIENTNLTESIRDKPVKSSNLNIKASPYAKKIAHQNNISLTDIQGSGPEGRIIKRDIKDIKLSYKKSTKAEIPSMMRKIIAERTTLTKQTVPHFYLTIESNVDKLLEMRKRIFADTKIKISINDILVKALAFAQEINPQTNVSWVDGGIIKYNTVDISIAVALDEGLITPIIKNANLKGLIEISKEIKYLADKAKKGKLIPEDYNGGTISISNLGMFGITEFSAIINPPQSSILAVGSIKKTPSIVNNEIKIANILKSTLSADHRVLDGAIAGKLLKDFNDIIEDPFNLWLMSDDMKVI